MISSPWSIARQAKTLTPALRARFSHLHIADHAAQPTSPWRGHHPAVWGRASSFGRGRTMRLIRFLRLSTPKLCLRYQRPHHGPQDPIAEREALGREPGAKAAPGIGRLGCGTTRTCTPPRRPLACSLKSHGSSGSHTVPSIRVACSKSPRPHSPATDRNGLLRVSCRPRERLLSPRHRRPLGHRLLGAGHGPSRRAEGARLPPATRPSAPPHRAFISVATSRLRHDAVQSEGASVRRSGHLQTDLAGRDARLAVLRRRIPVGRCAGEPEATALIDQGDHLDRPEHRYARSDDHAMDVKARPRGRASRVTGRQPGIGSTSSWSTTQCVYSENPVCPEVLSPATTTPMPLPSRLAAAAISSAVLGTASAGTGRAPASARRPMTCVLSSKRGPLASPVPQLLSSVQMFRCRERGAQHHRRAIGIEPIQRCTNRDTGLDKRLLEPPDRVDRRQGAGVD